MPREMRTMPYDERWPQRFQREADALREALGDLVADVHHIGSTSVPGLDAKPIIDVQISVASFDPLDAFRVPLESLGFCFRADNPDLNKRYFREPPGTRRTHIHVFRAGSWSEQIALLFRDYMRAHDENARRYAELKYRLTAQSRDDRRGYTASKSPFIWETMAKAHRWSQRTGWQPGPSDA